MIERKDLLPTMRGINKWIGENPEVTDPNMYQMIDCMTSIGVIASYEGIKDKPKQLPDEGTELFEIYREYYKMHKSRMSREKVEDLNHPANVNSDLYKYYYELFDKCFSGNLDLPKDKSKIEEYLECLKKIGSVSLFINQQERDNPSYTYDNYNEAKWINEKSEEFKEFLPGSSRAVVEQINREIEKSRNDIEIE